MPGAPITLHDLLFTLLAVVTIALLLIAAIFVRAFQRGYQDARRWLSGRGQRRVRLALPPAGSHHDR